MTLRAAGLCACLLVAACGDSAPKVEEITPSQPVNQVTILSAVPPGGTVLAPGSTVTLKYAFSYQLVTGDTGSIVMVLSDQQSRTLNEPGNYTNAPITRGSGTAELSHVLAIPSTGVSSIIVHFPMFVGTSTRSEPMAMVQYPVR